MLEHFTNKADADHFRDSADRFIEIEKGTDPDYSFSTDDLVREAREEGFDGVIINNVVDEGSTGGSGSPETVYVAFKPEQIKSTHNQGTYNPKDPNIMRSAAPVVGAGLLGSMLMSGKEEERQNY